MKRGALWHGLRGVLAPEGTHAASCTGPMLPVMDSNTLSLSVRPATLRRLIPIARDFSIDIEVFADALLMNAVELGEAARNLPEYPKEPLRHGTGRDVRDS